VKNQQRNQDAAMNQTINYQLSALRRPECLTEEQGDAVEGVICEHCGERLPQDAPAAARSLTVLCIDDDPLMLHFYRSFLEPRGYRTLLVTDGLAGLALAERDRPDVILLDVMLRGLSGFDICRKLHAERALRNTPIILLTVWDHPSVEPTGRAAGATLTLRKPANVETIGTAIAQVLGQPKAPVPSPERP
jgi:twitching motility two-component system response regulator PilH